MHSCVFAIASAHRSAATQGHGKRRCFQHLHCIIFCRYCIDRGRNCFVRGRCQCFDFVLSKMFETRKYALSEALSMKPLNLDRFRALWLIRYRQDVADTDAMAQYKDVCISPALVAVALGGRPFPDYSIKYTDPAGVTKRMDQLLDVATLGIGTVHPAVGNTRRTVCATQMTSGGRRTEHGLLI